MKNKIRELEPKKCWVGEGQKVCYEDQATAEGSARLVEAEHGLKPNSLLVYKCEYGEHWHLASQ